MRNLRNIIHRMSPTEQEYPHALGCDRPAREGRQEAGSKKPAGENEVPPVTDA